MPQYDPNQVGMSIDQIREKLASMEAGYLRARAYLKTGEFKQETEDVILKMTRCVFEYKAGDDATKAVFVIGKAQQMLNKFLETSDIVSEYESLKASIRRIEERMQ